MGIELKGPTIPVRNMEHDGRDAHTLHTGHCKAQQPLTISFPPILSGYYQVVYLIVIDSYGTCQSAIYLKKEDIF